MSEPKNDLLKDELQMAAEEESAVESTEEGDLEAKITELETEVSQLKSDVLRGRADMENLRKRLENQAEDRARYAVTQFAKEMLSVADNLRRALEAVPKDVLELESDEKVNRLAEGVEMTERELEAVMTKFAITKIEAQGQKFNPEYHQAMTEVEDANHPPGTVVSVMQQGYMIHDRLLRAALVVVSKAPPKTE